MENKVCKCGNHSHENCNCVNDKMIKHNIGGDEYYLSQDEINHIETLGFDTSNPSWKEDLINLKDYTTLANALFTLHKIDDAWEVIENHKEDINFGIILNTDENNPCPYFQLKRDAYDVYKYIHDNNIIDDISYAYFQVIGGKLSDIEFWKYFMGDKSVTDKFLTIHECYNGANPFEIGLVILDTESKEFMLEGIADKEVLDEFIIGKYPGVFFDKDLLLDLMSNNHLDIINYHKYFSIILQMINTDMKSFKDIEGITSDQSDIDIDSTYNQFWDTAYETIGSRIATINCNDDESLESFIKSSICKKLIDDAVFTDNEYLEDQDERQTALKKSRLAHEIIQTILLNSISFMNYPYKYRKMIEDLGYKTADGKIYSLDARYLFEDNYSYVLSYKLLEFVYCDNFIIKYPFPAIMNCIYNIYDNMIFINGECKPYDENDLDEFEFVYDYLYNNEINDDIFKKCQSLSEYEELVYAVKEFNDRIQYVLNNGVE